jgi:transposase
MHIMGDQVTRTKPRRRAHSTAFKRELVTRSLVPGASVSAIALEHGINANLLFAWRRAHLRATGAKPPAVLLPVTLESPTIDAVATTTVAAPRAATGTIEIDIGNARIQLRGPVDEASVRCVVQALRSAS